MLEDKAAQPKTRGPGRPAGEPGQITDERILDAAEREFATHGYAQTSLRAVAARIGVNQALLIYYFGGKQSLFEAVIKRRGREFAQRHAELLDALESSPEPISQGALVRAFLTPNFEMRDNGPNGIAFMRLLALLHFDSSEMALNLRREVYDATVKRYYGLFVRTLPRLDPLDVLWRINFIVGSMLYIFSGGHRIGDLSGHEYSDDWDRDEIVGRMTDFIVGGLDAAAGGRERPPGAPT